MGNRLRVTNIKIDDAEFVRSDDHNVTYGMYTMMPTDCLSYNFDSGEIFSELQAAAYFQRALVFETSSYSCDWRLQPWETKYNGKDHPRIHQPQLGIDFINGELADLMDSGELPTIEVWVEYTVPREIDWAVDVDDFMEAGGSVEHMIDNLFRYYLRVDVQLRPM